MEIRDLIKNSNDYDRNAASKAVVEAIILKIKSGKDIRDFDEDDWLEIAKASGYELNTEELVKNAEKYLVQLISVINATAPQEVQKQMPVVRVMVQEQAKLFKSGEISELEFIETCELICLEATVRAISEKVGEFSISLPYLGTVIENTNCEMLYRMARDYLDDYEAQLIESYIVEIRALEKKLDEKYWAYVDALSITIGEYLDKVDKAFDDNSEVAFKGSVELAESVGLQDSEILDSKEEIDEFFN